MAILFAFAELTPSALAATGGAISAKTPPLKTNPAKTATRTPPSTPRQLPDAQIERTIKAKLAKSKLNADHFTVTVQNGTATIEGSTNILQHKGVMTRMARTSGAATVQNNIRVSDEAKASAAQRLAKNRTPLGGLPRATVAEPAGKAK